MHIGSISRALAGVLALGVIQLAGPATHAVAAGVAAPHNLSPNSKTVHGQPILSWGTSRGAVSYDVQVATSNKFSSTLYSTTTDNNKATPTTILPPDAGLFWRVRANSASGGHSSWSVASFTHAHVAGPKLVSPASGTTLAQPQSPPLLRWNPVAGADGYTVEVDTADNFVGATDYDARTTSFVLPSPGPQTTYYWRVQATFAAGYVTSWSQPRSFAISAIKTPTLVSPADDFSTPIQDVVLDWKPVAGAVKYQVRVSTNDQFSDDDTPIDVVVKSTRYSPPVTLDNDQYWWEVRAIDAHANPSPWTATPWVFQRNWLDQIELLNPINDDDFVSDPFYFEWSPIAHASSYVIDVSRDPNFSPHSYDECVTKETTYTPGFSSTCEPKVGINYWRVKALDGSVNSTYSDIFNFTYNPTTVEQLSPEDGEVVDVPTLTWEAFPNAQKYKVTIYKKTGTVATSLTTYATSFTPTGSTSPLKASDAPFTWTVQALRRDGTATVVPITGPTFDVTGSVPDDPEVSSLTPISPNPAAQGTVLFPPLVWEPYTEGSLAYYTLWIGQAGIFHEITSPRYPYSAGTDATNDYLTPGNYDWFVQAHSSNGAVLMTGPQSSFVIRDMDDVSGQTLSLTGSGLQNSSSRCSYSLNNVDTTKRTCSSLQQTPVLHWNDVPFASYYMVYVAADKQMTNLVIDPTRASEAITDNTTWTPSAQLKDSQAGTAYYWVIRACKVDGICAPDPTMATNSFDKKSNPVGGLNEYQHESTTSLPKHGPDGATDAPSFADEIVLSWDDYLDTNQLGNTTDVTGLPATMEAGQYKVQISDDPNFGTGFVYTSKLLDQTTFTAYDTTLPEGPLYWRVQAYDGTGNALAWSVQTKLGNKPRAIEKVSPAPSLTSPVGGKKVDGTPYLQWKPLNYANNYNVEIYKNGDTTYSSANRVYTASTSQPAVALTRLLDASDGPFVWRVRKTDIDGRIGAWSKPGRFSINKTAPVLVSPANNGKVSGKRALFRWKAVAGAATYRFEYRGRGSTDAAFAETTAALAWAPEDAIEKGRYEWRVSSYDGMGQLIGTSTWRAFTAR